MEKPNIADRTPAVMELEAGSYWWCACGLSKGQPFCDGSHVGSGFMPKEFKLDEKQKVALCRCKSTKNKPFCDGTHRII